MKFFNKRRVLYISLTSVLALFVGVLYEVLHVLDGLPFIIRPVLFLLSVYGMLTIPFAALFPLSLITYHMKEETFRAWLQFAVRIVVLTYVLFGFFILVSSSTGGFGLAGAYRDAFVALVFGVLGIVYVIGSITIIIQSHQQSGHRKSFLRNKGTVLTLSILGVVGALSLSGYFVFDPRKIPDVISWGMLLTVPFMPLGILFPFSLITYHMSEVVFQKWLSFSFRFVAILIAICVVFFGSAFAEWRMVGVVATVVYIVGSGYTILKERKGVE